MDFMDKLGRFARKAGNKAGDIIEIGRLTAKIHAEKAAADRVKLQIGDFVWNQFQSGSVQPVEVVELCEKIKDSMAAIEILQNAILDLKAPCQDDDIPCGGCQDDAEEADCCCDDETTAE